MVYKCTNSMCPYGPAWDRGQPVPHIGINNTVAEQDRANAYSQDPAYRVDGRLPYGGLCLNCVADNNDKAEEQDLDYIENYRSTNKLSLTEKITMIPNKPETHPPKDGSWIWVIIRPGLNRVEIQFDPKWGKTGGWFDRKNHAISETGIFQWEKPASKET